MSRLLNIIGSKKFRLRLLSGLVLVLLAFLILRQGGKLLFFSMMAISLVGQYELYRVLKMEREPLGAVGYLSSIGYYLLLLVRHYDYGMPLMIGTLMALMALFVLSYPRYRTEQICRGAYGCALYNRHVCLRVPRAQHAARRVSGLAHLYFELGL